MSAADWYGVRCVFAYGRGSSARASDERIGYEERVTVWRAETFDNAIAKAEAEAEGYASDVDAEYVGLAQAYRMADDLVEGAEVFSLIRSIDMPADEYVHRFFATGAERQDDLGGTATST